MYPDHGTALESRQPINDKPFKHKSRHGTLFMSKRSDFKSSIDITLMNSHISDDNLLKDVAEMIGHHALKILPGITGFAGYDRVEFFFETPRPGPATINRT